MFIDRIKSPVIVQELTQVIQEAAARDVSVELVVAGAASGSAGAAAAGGGRKPPSQAAKPGPKAKQVLKKFGGRVVQVNPKDRIKERPTGGPAEQGFGDETLDPGTPPQD